MARCLRCGAVNIFQTPAPGVNVVVLFRYCNLCRPNWMGA